MLIINAKDICKVKPIISDRVRPCARLCTKAQLTLKLPISLTTYVWELACFDHVVLELITATKSLRTNVHILTYCLPIITASHQNDS